MRQKRDNNLVMINYKDGEKLYFTSLNKAGMKVGITNPSVTWAIKRHNTLVDFNDRQFTIEIVDGSEVPYKLINN